MRWAFDPGNEDPNAVLMPGKDYTRSTPNSWAPISYDPAMNAVFLPMGSSSVDLWVPTVPRWITNMARRCWRWTPPPVKKVGVSDGPQ